MDASGTSGLVIDNLSVAQLLPAASTQTLGRIHAHRLDRMKIVQSQIDTCREHGADYSPLDLDSKLGISDNFFSGELPLNGLRHPPQRDTCGWYLWAGEMSKETDFFKPLHVSHVVDRYASLARYLGLPPGWRFLLADDHEDVWFDSTLFEI